MKEYDVTITETLQRKVTVEAETTAEAQEKVSDAWDHQDYVLGAEDFVGVAFDTVDERSLDQEKELVDALLVKPNEYPQAVKVGIELEDLQAAVGGYIEVTYPFDDQVGVVLNEEGKLMGLPLNRAVYTEDGDMHDIYVGDFLVMGLTEESFCSLTPEQMKTYEEKFHQPEMFIKMGRSIMAVPIPDDMVKKDADRVAGLKPEKDKPPRGNPAL